MKYWIDTEFIDLRPGVHLISIGIVAEDGREYYAEVDDYPRHLACEWVRENVFPHLTGPTKHPRAIAADIEQFVDDKPEFWLWYGAYDWVAMTQLWGRMVDSPKWSLSCYYNDLRNILTLCHPGMEPPPKPENAHNALADARWTKALWEYKTAATRGPINRCEV